MAATSAKSTAAKGALNEALARKQLYPLSWTKGCGKQGLKCMNPGCGEELAAKDFCAEVKWTLCLRCPKAVKTGWFCELADCKTLYTKHVATHK